MKLWSFFVRWLAKKEIDKSFDGGMAAAGVFASQSIDMAKRVSFAEGQIHGRTEMYEHISRIVGARMEGAQDYINPEDLALAKKGLLH